ncbi:MAG: ferredoxin family protein [Dehalococcoidia bacterium]|nr:ferredoxin family protein [Dehalococcoidia bacterium]
MGVRKIDYRLCSGCGICVEHCPMDVFRMDEKTKKPVIKYLRDCQSCFLCEIDCPEQAMYVTPDREMRVPLPW